MIDPSHELPIARQAAALGISRGSVYYLPRSVPASDVAIMRRIDGLHLDLPFAGSRMRTRKTVQATRASSVGDVEVYRALGLALGAGLDAQIDIVRDVAAGAHGRVRPRPQ